MSLLEEQSMLITTEPSLQAFPAKTLLNTCNMLVFLFGTEDALGLVPWVHAQLIVRLTLLGSTTLDHALEEHYQLLVQVKDMGDQPSGHQAMATLEISIVENSWTPLEPVHLAENLRVAYPHSIAQVRSG